MDVKELIPGRFCWIELSTTDEKAAASFYEKMFDWNVEVDELPGDMGTYTKLLLGDRELGGLYKLSPEMLEMGIPPNWLCYVGVESVDATVDKAKALGGTVAMGPLDVMEHGRMAVLQDPTGASFALWEAKEHCGHQVENENGATCWFELLTDDTKKAGTFYADLFGWQVDDQDVGPIRYMMFMHGERPAAGMMKKTEEMGEGPSCWMVYFSVGDCDESVQTAEALGAQVFAPPMDIDEVGRMAVLADPLGAVFSIIRLTTPS